MARKQVRDGQSGCSSSSRASFLILIKSSRTSTHEYPQSLSAWSAILTTSARLSWGSSSYSRALGSGTTGPPIHLPFESRGPFEWPFAAVGFGMWPFRSGDGWIGGERGREEDAAEASWGWEGWPFMASSSKFGSKDGVAESRFAEYAGLGVLADEDDAVVEEDAVDWLRGVGGGLVRARLGADEVSSSSAGSAWTRRATSSASLSWSSSRRRTRLELGVIVGAVVVGPGGNEGGGQEGEVDGRVSSVLVGGRQMTSVGIDVGAAGFGDEDRVSNGGLNPVP